MKGLGAGVTVLLTVVNYVGVRFGGMVQNVFSIAKMAAMAGPVSDSQGHAPAAV